MHDLGQNMATSDLCYCLLTLRSSSQVTDLVGPRTYLMCQNWSFRGFLEVLRPNMWLIFHIDVFIGLIGRFLCRSGPWSQFALRRFFRCG